MKIKQCSSLTNIDKYNSIFATRLRNALDASNLTQKKLAESVGVSPQMISLYCSGYNAPQLPVLAAIAKELNVTIDYLLGLAENESVLPEVRNIGDYTGLQTNSIEVLHKYKSVPLFIATVNFLLTNLGFLESIADFLTVPLLDAVTKPPYDHVNLVQPVHDKLSGLQAIELHDCAVTAQKDFAVANAENNKLQEYVADRYVAKYSTGSRSCSIPQHTHAYDSFDMLYSLSKQALLDQRKRERDARTKNETRENDFLSGHGANKNASPATQNESESDFLTEYERFVQTLDFFGISDILHVNSIKMAEQSAATVLDSSKSD